MSNPVKNPFRSRDRRRQYDSCIQAYRDRRRIFFTPEGVPHKLNSFAAAFWAGYDGKSCGLYNFTPGEARNAGIYVFWRAGREIAKTEERDDG